ncbi:DUF6456 domain-containing protein [Pseudohoeflea coraliihabitans]|uniref:DUF6456 domain-containing protein n=1 Tax=Pseudohoeflea coraliihabitans TaxID=2860393 RepID=A0ABS6WRQ0_9HYPH|nr:DUF6456 domain-containing protein [Pseudohoeflea sp. DP4N28-3]MBW3098641.1 hypothetical protein [Pseudohoeflea sp. DP4N28-3]
MTRDDSATTRRARLKLYRFLAHAGDQGCSCARAVHTAGPEEGLALERPDGRSLTVAAACLTQALRRGGVTSVDRRLRLTRAGVQSLKRLLAEDDGFADQHGERTFRPCADGERVKINLDESPLGGLARLRRRDGTRWFPSDLLDAGDRLRADFTRGHYMPGISASMQPVVSRGTTNRTSGVADLADAALAARLRVEKALDAVGPELAGLLVDICCFLKGLETVERERQWPQRSAKLLLHAGLEMLARHYRGPRRKEPHQTTARCWGAPGYRPDLAADLERNTGTSRDLSS